MAPLVTLQSDPRIVSAVLVLGAALLAQAPVPAACSLLADFCSGGVPSLRVSLFLDYAFRELRLADGSSEAPLALVLIEGQVALEEVEA